MIEEFHFGDHVIVANEVGAVEVGAGEPRAGAPVFLLVHGIGMGKDAYIEFIEALGKRGTCIAIDLPGFGDAPQPERSLSMPEMGQLLARFIERRGCGPVVAVGHSMGTQVVAELAVQRPDLVHRLVLIAPTVNALERTPAWQVWRMLQDLAGGASVRTLTRGLWLYLRTGPTWFVRKFRTMISHRIEFIAPKITVPTLVMRGEDDRVCPEGWTRIVAELIPNSEYTQVPGRSHEAMISSAEPVADLVDDFVRGTSG